MPEEQTNETVSTPAVDVNTDKVVLVDKINLPEGFSRATHFYVINKDFQVVAIKRTPEMFEKAKATRTTKAKVKRDIAEKKKKLLVEKEQRKATRIAERKAKIEKKLKRIEDAEAKRKAKYEKILSSI